MHALLMFARPAVLAPTLVCAALLAACGGGGDDAGETGAITNDAATTAAANATLMSSDATAAVDASVLAAQAVVSTQATAAAAAGMHTLSTDAGEGTARATAVANVPVACPGGGTATLTITGGTVTSILNGQFDTGEVYQLVYSACRGAAGAVQVNGTQALTVESATATSLSVSMVATGLAVALPRGTVTLAGSTAYQVSTSGNAAGGTDLSSHVSSSGLTLATQFNNRSSTFTLSALDITRQSSWVGDVVQGSSINGTHTLAATLPGGAFSHTVSTQGSVSYSASGVPVSGSWTITLPNARLGVTVANALATITVDEGKDGTTERTFTVPVTRLQTDAG